MTDLPTVSAVPTVGGRYGWADRFGWRTSWLWGLFVVSRVCVLILLAGRGTDLGVHQRYGLLVRQGQIPFANFDAEYPPLAVVFDALPTLADPTGVHYFGLFRAVMVCVDVGVWCGLLWATRGRAGPGLLYLVCSTLLGPVLYDRLDLVLRGLMLAAAVAADRGRWAAAGLWAGAGVAFKLIPVVWVPVLVVLAWRRGGGRAAGRLVGCLALVPVATVGPLVPTGSAGLANLYRYHAERGIEVESVPAVVELSAMACGLTTGATHYDHGSTNLTSDVAGPIAGAATVALAVSVVGLAAAAWAWPGVTASSLLLATLLAAMSFSKVLSPQYFLVLLPVLCACDGPADGRRHPVAWSACVAAFALTGIIYPFQYLQLVQLQSLACDLVMFRGDLLVLIAIWVCANLSGKKIGRPHID